MNSKLYVMRIRLAVVLVMILLISCRGEKESTYFWKSPDESRTATLLKDGKLVLEINAGYYHRVDTCTYERRGDTLVINAAKAVEKIDSLVAVDSLFNGQRFLEVFAEDVELGPNVITGTFYRPVIFPAATINETTPLSISPDDQTYHWLLIPDSVVVQRITATVFEENTCRPNQVVTVELPAGASSDKSYRIYVKSRHDKKHYLAGFKWLIRGDTLQTFFKNDQCDPGEIKLVRK